MEATKRITGTLAIRFSLDRKADGVQKVRKLTIDKWTTAFRPRLKVGLGAVSPICVDAIACAIHAIRMEISALHLANETIRFLDRRVHVVNQLLHIRVDPGGSRLK